MSDQLVRDEAPAVDDALEPADVGAAGRLEVRARIDPASVIPLARLHLRMGLYTLARAELEALRVLESLDDDGLEALAEACWRTGDLPAAGRVAVPMAQSGSTRPLVLVIAAESIAAQGRPGEAGRFVSLAMDAIEVPLDTLFSGLPRHASWPAVAPDEHSASGLAVAPMVAASETASSAAAEAYAGGRAALAAGDAARAALEMGVALRLDPGFATEVLDVIGTRATDPGLVLVAGDALRILGREQEALAAFDTARGAAALAADVAVAAPDAPGPATGGGELSGAATDEDPSVELSGAAADEDQDGDSAAATDEDRDGDSTAATEQDRDDHGAARVDPGG